MGWAAIAISVIALAVAAFSWWEAHRANQATEAQMERERQAEFAVESVTGDRRGMGNDVLVVVLRNVGRADAVAIDGEVRLPPAFYKLATLGLSAAAGASVPLGFELPTGTIVREPRQSDGAGGWVGEPRWMIPGGSYVHLRFTDASGAREERIPIGGGAP